MWRRALAVLVCGLTLGACTTAPSAAPLTTSLSASAIARPATATPRRRQPAQRRSATPVSSPSMRPSSPLATGGSWPARTPASRDARCSSNGRSTADARGIACGPDPAPRAERAAEDLLRRRPERVDPQRSPLVDARRRPHLARHRDCRHGAGTCARWPGSTRASPHEQPAWPRAAALSAEWRPLGRPRCETARRPRGTCGSPETATTSIWSGSTRPAMAAPSWCPLTAGHRFDGTETRAVHFRSASR